jgi:excisionase family DNA binding protein
LRVPVASTRSAAAPGARLLTIKEIADVCQLSEKAVRRAIDDGELVAVKLRSRLRVTPEDFEAWITAQRQQRFHATQPARAPRPRRRAPAGTFRALVHGATEPGLSP